MAEPASAQKVTPRYTALDGLRGIAAFVVVVFHSLLVMPTLAAAQEGVEAGREDAPPGLALLLSSTPLRLVWAGEEAVYVFFVLSGFVVILPFLRERRMPWIAYYPRRLLRLYLPVVAAVGFAIGTVLLVPRTNNPDQSWWLNAQDIDITFGLVARDMLLISGTSWLNSPLWSLRWEVIFSLLLPLYLLFAIMVRRFWAPALAVLLGAMTVFELLGMMWPVYLGMFAAGSLIAANREAVTRLGSKLRPPAWAGLVILAVLLLSAPERPFGWIPASAAVLGAALILFVFLENRSARRLGDLKPMQWMGSRSFSIYLVHEPIVVSVAILLGPQRTSLVLPIAVVASLMLGELFYRMIEGPSHRLATVLGRAAERTASRGWRGSRDPLDEPDG